nr:ATP-binding protein [uncultured Moraxella sp.]
MKNNTSIQSKLLKSLLIGLPLLWLVSTATINIKLWHELNGINDTQIVQLTRYLLSTSADKNNYPPIVKSDVKSDHHDDEDDDKPTIYQVDELLSDDFGEADDDYIGFAIWDNTGKLLMADENGQNFVFLPNQHGFLDDDNAKRQYLNPFSQDWRLLYIQDKNNARIIAVGQNLESRGEILTQAILAQSLPSFVGLFAFILFVMWAIRQGFKPLNSVSKQLANRNPQDDTPLDSDVPKEIAPLVGSLNDLFVKIADTLEREQRFTADASHELRSPLTALKLQADILEQEILQSNLNEKTEESLFYHAQQIGGGIERANHLVEQLLILAKLTPEQGLNKNELMPINWLEVSDNVLKETNRFAREKHSQLKREILHENPLAMTGNATLLQLLLRNLLDNAIRYCPQNSTITLVLDKDKISVIDNGKGVSDDNLARLSERFFRPAGQSERGSGLGLSIVKRIAELHSLAVTFGNRMENGKIVGFGVSLHLNNAIANKQLSTI